MTHLIFAPRGTLKRRSKLYAAVHAELMAKPSQPETSKQQRKTARRISFLKTGDVHG